MPDREKNPRGRPRKRLLTAAEIAASPSSLAGEAGPGSGEGDSRRPAPRSTAPGAPRTLRELLSESAKAAAPLGIRCPNCHCKDMSVYLTRHKPNSRIQRVRVCNHCGKRLLTFESPG